MNDNQNKEAFLELGNKLQQALAFYDWLDAIPDETNLALLLQDASKICKRLDNLIEPMFLDNGHVTGHSNR